MQSTILQFPTLTDLALYAREVAGKGFQINTQNLTLKSKLSDEEIILARQQFRAQMIEKPQYN
ncbi:hypothetical protein HRG84_05950 [Flavisolibacter sp. BT320]|nr:hypothetical protein [Flavisolibacter longurius]